MQLFLPECVSVLNGGDEAATGVTARHMIMIALQRAVSDFSLGHQVFLLLLAGDGGALALGQRAFHPSRWSSCRHRASTFATYCNS